MKRLLKSFNKMSKQRQAVTGFALLCSCIVSRYICKTDACILHNICDSKRRVPITVGPTTTVREKIQKLAENHTNRKYRRC